MTIATSLGFPRMGRDRDRLWINPDCGLKTRGWPEVTASLTAMVAAARRARG